MAVRGVPPFTEEAKLRLLTGGGVTVKEVVFVETPDEAVNVTEVLLHCGVLEMGTCRYRDPAGTVTVLGTEATAGLLLDRFTTQPPAGAFAPRYRTSVAGAFPGAEDGLTLTEEIASCRVNDAWAVAPSSAAVIVPVVALLTYDEEILKLA